MENLNAIFVMSQTRFLEPGDRYQSEKKTSEVSVAQTGKYLRPQKGISNQNVRECFLLGLEWFALDPIAFCIVCVSTRNHNRKLQFIFSGSFTARAGAGDLQGFSLKCFR